MLRNCILSIKKYFHGFEYEVIVADNNSPNPEWKSLISEFPDVLFLSLEENLGFSKANNLAVTYAKGEYVYILNPDTEIEGDYFKEILDFADSQFGFGALGLRMHNAKGEFLPESKRSVPALINSFEKLFTPFNSNSKSYYRNDVGEFDIAEVDIMTGANLLVKKSVYAQVGGFDEQYFMYGEDIDLCYTIRRSGFRNFYYGKYSILHYKGESTVKDEVYLGRFYYAMAIFIGKYYKKQKPLQYLLMKFGLTIKHASDLKKLTHLSPEEK